MYLVPFMRYNQTSQTNNTSLVTVPGTWVNDEEFSPAVVTVGEAIPHSLSALLMPRGVLPKLVD